MRHGTTSDSYTLRFAADLNPILTAFAVADPTGRPELHVVFALPAGRLRPHDADGATTYPLALRLVVYDTAHRAVGVVDTVRVFRSAQRLREGQYLTERLVVAVPPGRFRFHFVVQEIERDAGALAAAREVDVPRFDAGFAVSDLVLGREGSGLAWRRRDEPVPLNPLASFPPDGVATLYYELHGLPAGARVDTRVRVVRQGSRSLLRRVLGGGASATLAYTTVTGAPGRVEVRQQLVLTGLRPGRYRVEVSLTDPVTGRGLTRSQSFEVARPRAP